MNKRDSEKIKLPKVYVRQLRAELDRMLKSDDIAVVRYAARLFRRYPELGGETSGLKNEALG